MPIFNQTIDNGDASACEFLLAALSSLDYVLETVSISQTTSNFQLAERLKFQSNAQLKKMLSFSSESGSLSLVHALLDLLSHPTDSNGHGNGTDNGTGTATTNGTAAGHSHTTSLYAKTSAIQILSKLTSTNATLVHSQILSAPDGLHRIVVLLNPSTMEEESIRNEALVLCTIMAKTNAGSARLMIFGEAYDKVMDIAMEDNVESKVKKDCLKLMIEMTKQDEMGAEVFLGSGRLVRHLALFLDLRVGNNFINPSEELHDENDDLDDIMNHAKSNHRDAKKTKGNQIPYLTENEAEVTLFALELFRVLVVGDHDSLVFAPMTKIQSRQKSIMMHDILTRLLIDMALYTLPPPDSPASVYVCAVPPLHVQLRALDIFAVLTLGSSEEMQQSLLAKKGIYLHAGVLDRIMYLICTGDGANRGSEISGGADKISMHCLGVLRCLLSAKDASTMMMYTLAPPPPENDNGVVMSPEAPEVQRLVNTLGENLHVFLSEEIRKELKVDDKKRISRMIIGSAGALGIFLTNGAGDTTREILLRVPMPPPPPSPDSVEQQENGTYPSLVDVMIRFVEFCSNDMDSLLEMRNVVAAVLRLFMEWVPSTPSVISALMSSASSVSLGVLLQQKQNKTDAPTISALSGVLLGLCMDNMKAEDDIGGWSISTIMNLINVGLGIGKFTQLLESLKHYMMKSDEKPGVEPWSCCEVERKHLLQWYASSVGIVRKRAIQEFTLSNGNHSDSDGEDGIKADAPSARESKAMKKFVSQQTTEIDVLKSKLAEAEVVMSAKSSEVKELWKRMESNPSQLDDLLNECTTQISDLEIQNRALSSKLTFKEYDFKQRIREKDATSMQVQKELEKARKETRNVLEDKTNLQEELTGLTSAYTNLEGEYNRVAASGASHTNEKVMPMSSYQIIQDENLKLKENIKVSNNWMKKAQQKIDDLVKNTVKLQSESDIGASQIAKKLEITQTSLDATQQQFNNVSTDRDTLITEVESLKERICTQARQEQGMEINEKIISLTSEILNLRKNTEAECKQYTASVAGLEQGLVSKDLIIFDLEKLAEVTSNSQQGDAEKMQKLQEEVKNLKTANKAAKEWMADAHKRHTSMKEQLQKLKEGNSVLAKEQEERLSAPSNAQVLKEVSMDRDAARIRLVDLEAKLFVIETSEEKRSKQMIKELGEQKCQSDEQERELAQLNEQLESDERKFLLERQTLIEDKNETTKLFAETQTELEVLRKELVDARSSAVISSSEYEEQNTAIIQMTAEIQMIKDENDNLVSQREGHVAAIEDMRNRLTDFNSWSETAQQRISELESEKEASDDRINEMEQNLKNVSVKNSDSEAAILRSNNLEVDLTNAYNKINILEQEIIVLKNNSEQAQSDLQKESNTEESGQNQNDAELELQQSKEDINILQEVELNRLRSEVLIARKRIVDLKEQKSASDAKIQFLEEGERKAKDQCDEFAHELQHSNDKIDAIQEIIDTNKSELYGLKTEMTVLQGTLSILETEKELALSKIQELLFKEKEQEETIESRKLDAAEVEILRGDISNLQMQIDDLTQSNIDLQCKADLLDEVEENMFEKENDVSQLRDVLNKAKEAFDDLQVESESAIVLWKVRVDDLESDIGKLESQVVEQEEEATEAIVLWKQRCAMLEAELVDTQSNEEIEKLRVQLAALKEDIVVKQVMFDEMTANLTIEKDNVETLTKENSDAERIYKDHIEELELAMQDHLNTNEELQDDLQSKEDNLTNARKEITAITNEIVEIRSQSEEVVTQWQENSKELEDTIVELEGNIEKQNDQATTAIEQWEARCNALVEQIQKVEEDLANDDLHQHVEHLEAELEDKVRVLQECTEERDCLAMEKNSLVAIEDRLSITVNEIKAEKADLNSALLAIKSTSLTLEIERNNAIASLDLEKSKLDSEITAKQGLQASYCEFQALFDATKVEMERIRVGRETLQQKYETEKQELEEKISSEEDEKNRFQDTIHISEDEISELKMIIGQLEVELNEANDALQSHFTDEVTIIATERAASALRAQIKEMRDKHMFDHQALAHEKEARLNVEVQVEELKRDLVLLAQATEQMDGEEGQVQFMTSKAAAEIMHREREEIESLQRSLEHVIAELKSSKLMERDAEDKAANSRMHASVCEQELLSTKSDVDQLRQSLNEAKHCEAQMQKLLEKRVKALEIDRQNIMNANRDGYEGLKAELSNTIIERDQLIHALNESEKANSTLVYSTTVEIEKDNVPSPDLELSRLRMENAQLLCSAAKTAARTERRVKSALAGDLSAVEQEINSEKQQCEEAKQTLETMKAQYKDVVEELGKMKLNNEDLMTKLKSFEVNNVAEDMKQLQADFSRLLVEKKSLETDLSSCVTTSKSIAVKLEEKCNAAEAKIRRLESAEHKEASLAAEIARIQDENRALNRAKLESVDDMATSIDAKCEVIDPMDQLDLIHGLQSEMNAERESYQDLLVEHEDLLALLAQQDCEKKCLQHALAEVDGNDAVEKAILQAEEQVVEQFGKYVQIKQDR